MEAEVVTDTVPSEEGFNKTFIDEEKLEKIENKELTAPSTPQTQFSGDCEESRQEELPDKIENKDSVDMVTTKQGTEDLKSSHSSIEDIAMSLFKEEFILIQPEEYTQYLASTEEENSKVRSRYMDLFKWKPNVLESTRILCSKLYLKGESQEIDRILTAFTKSYLKQHPTNVFCTRDFEKMYIVIYSLILLNTALHNSGVDTRSKISQSEYVRNTFSTFVSQSSRTLKALSIRQRILIERELSKYYEDLAREELHLKQIDTSTNTKKQNKYTNDTAASSPSKSAFLEDSEPISRQLSGSSIWSTTSNRKSLAVNRTSTNTTKNYENKPQSPRGFTRALLTEQNQKFQRSPIKNHAFSHLHSGMNRRSSRSSIISKESIFSSIGDDLSILSFEEDNSNSFGNDYNRFQNLEDFKVDDYQDSYDLTLELAGSPYLKEGLLKVKVLHNDDSENMSIEANASSSSSFVSVSTSKSSTNKFFSLFRSSNNLLPSGRNSNKNSLLTNRFTDNFVVVSKGELSLYSFDPKLIKKEQERKKKLYGNSFGSEEDSDNVGDGNWLKNAVNVGNYNLCSTFAQLERHNNHVNKPPYTWSLKFSKVSRKEPMKMLFEAGTKEIALEFVNTCNFWASKITAIPTLEEIASSIDYGWNDLEGLIKKKDQLKKLKNIQKWEPLPKGIYFSAYIVNEERGDGYHEGMMKQFIKTLKYYKHLKNSFNEFTIMRKRFITTFSLNNSSNCTKILGNYDNKLAYYKEELAKYKDYLIILAYGLQLRFDLQTKEKEINEDLDDEELENEDELTKRVKYEIVRLLADIKNIHNVIPNFYSHEDEPKDPNQTDQDRAFTLVKSPKTFTLSNLKDNEAPVQQIFHDQVSGVEMVQSYSTNTIKEEPEEEEPEEEESGEEVKLKT